MRKRPFLLITALMISVVFCAQSTPSQDNVIAQMNYCTNALTNIINNKSMDVLAHESDQLINNLTMEQVSGIYDINEYRKTLLETVSRFQITEEERMLVKRIQSIKNDNLKWQALSSALSPTMLLTGGGGFGYQAAFQALVTTARAGVEYKMAQGEQKIEALQALWELRKTDMTDILTARKDAQEIVYNLFGSYKLQECDRLTEKSSLELLQYISVPNARRRVSVLEDNKDKYKKYAPYYYHLGMAYVDNNEYTKAKPYFDKYTDLYSKAPIFRYDEMSGCIALTKLAYERNLSYAQKVALINTALKNLPGNSAASIQCALVYINDLNQTEKGLNLIRAAIDDPNASERDLLYLCVANMYPLFAKYPSIISNINENINQENYMLLNTYLQYTINKTPNAWSSINSILKFNDTKKGSWYTAGIGTIFNDNFEMLVDSRYIFHQNDFKIYKETYSDDDLEIEQLTPFYKDGISIDKINKVECFKSNKALKYLFLEELEPNKTFRVKKNLDYDKIKEGTWPRMSEFTLSESDQNDIIKFCKKHTPDDFSNIYNSPKILDNLQN